MRLKSALRRGVAGTRDAETDLRTITKNRR